MHHCKDATPSASWQHQTFLMVIFHIYFAQWGWTEDPENRMYKADFILLPFSTAWGIGFWVGKNSHPSFLWTTGTSHFSVFCSLYQMVVECMRCYTALVSLSTKTYSSRKERDLTNKALVSSVQLHKNVHIRWDCIHTAVGTTGLSKFSWPMRSKPQYWADIFPRFSWVTTKLMPLSFLKLLPRLNYLMYPPSLKAFFFKA